MKKGLKFYAIAWAIMFILFNVAVAALPKEFTLLGVTYEKFGGLSWVTLIVLELCFLLHLGVTALALNQNKLSGTFYRIPLIRLSYGCVAVTLILAVLAMLVFIPSWIPLALALLILAVYAFAVLKAEVAAELVEGVDAKTRAMTSFIRDLTADADSLLSRAKSEPVKAACKKVFEALRYSDPVSAYGLVDVEERIKAEFDVLTDAVIADDPKAVSASADELLTLIAERNKKSKAGK
jgi:hypothetical protein